MFQQKEQIWDIRECKFLLERISFIDHFMQVSTQSILQSNWLSVFIVTLYDS